MKTNLLHRSVLLVLLACAASGPRAMGLDIRITALVMSGTPVPGQTALFRSFGNIASGPSMDGNTVAFTAVFSDSPSQLIPYAGIFTYEDGTVNTVVDTSTPVPGTNEHFRSFGSAVYSSGSRVFFSGNWPGGGGIFKVENGVVTKFVDETDFVAGNDNWSASGDIVAFCNGAGVYAVISNTLFAIASQATPVPGGSGNFSSFSGVSVDGDEIAFSGNDPNGLSGIYLAQSGHIAVLVNETMPIPGSPGIPFRNIPGLSLRDNGVAFHGDEGTPFLYGGVYRLYNGVLSAVANTSVPLPDQPGNFGRASALAFDGGNVAFLGLRPDSSQALYTFVGDQMVLVADNHTSINGFVPGGFWLNPHGISGNSIVFGSAMNTPTGSVHGLFRADIVPGEAVPVSADYDGDGGSDQAYYDPDTSTWFIRSKDNKEFETRRFGYGPVVPTPGDYDADGVTDLAVYDPYYGTWYIMASHDGFSTSQFGYYGAVPVPADYDGDGRADIAVFDPGTGWWFIHGSTDGFHMEQFGYYGTTAVPADFDNDGKADIAVYEHTRGLWYIHRSSSDDLVVQQFGYAGVTPVTSDFDGHGADFGVFDRASGNWFTHGQVDGFAIRQFGYHGVLPVSADYDGDAKGDLGVYDPNAARWYLLRTSAGFHSGGL